MRQVLHRLDNGCGGALHWLREDCLQFGRHTEDDAAATIQPSPGSSAPSADTIGSVATLVATGSASSARVR
jgi:hypothetical protein